MTPGSAHRQTGGFPNKPKHEVDDVGSVTEKRIPRPIIADKTCKSSLIEFSGLSHVQLSHVEYFWWNISSLGLCSSSLL